MLLLKYLLLVSGFGLLGVSSIILAFDAYRAAVQSMVPVPEGTPGAPIAWRWRATVRLAAMAAAPLLVALSIVVIPSGYAAVRVSQLSGTVPGTLYPGTHFVVPLFQHAEVYDVRDVVYTTSAVDNPKQPAATLKAQSREGLAIGLGVTVRYRLDPVRLASVHDSLPRAIDADVVAPVVASAFRQSIPNYMVREAFATRREEVRRETAQAITRTDHRAPGQGAGGRDAAHAPPEGEADPADPAGGGSSKGSDGQERGGCGDGEGD